jgi:hypothetical protein
MAYKSLHNYKYERPGQPQRQVTLFRRPFLPVSRICGVMTDRQYYLYTRLENDKQMQNKKMRPGVYL